MKVICFIHEGTSYFATGEMAPGTLAIDGVFEYNAICMDQMDPHDYLQLHALDQGEAERVIAESLDAILELLL